MNIDLIYVDYGDRREMSVALINEPNSKQLGPVAGKEAIKNLAPLLAAELPAQFQTVKSAEDYLTVIHFGNMTRHANSAGQDYPYKVRP